MSNINEFHIYIITKKKIEDIILLNKIIHNNIQFSLNRRIIFHFDRSDPSYPSLYTIINYIGKDEANIESRSYKGESFKIFCNDSHISPENKFILFICKPYEKSEFLEYKNFAIYCDIKFKFTEYKVKKIMDNKLNKVKRNVLNRIGKDDKVDKIDIKYDPKNDRVIYLKIKNKEFVISEYQYLLQNIMLYIRYGLK